ncbi:methyl-accepting chemotaxis protein [Bacillus sp. 2205SS5-2]|uniref:methyl-accepting chemotaxis protein n=1 Tax=Bacillus sp. 2205SS5-2 TaxID=3109031 RepID=UPI003FA60179
MVDNMEEVLQLVNTSVNDVRNSAENLSGISEETNASSEEMAQAVIEIAAGASKSAEDAELTNQQSLRLSEQINELSLKARNMSLVAANAEKTNQIGREQMNMLQDSYHSSQNLIGDMFGVIKELAEKVTSIEHVIKTITDISTQTNLLALNASIEAARAGEHGKGFAVVADEVRKLAEQTVAATEEVKITISQIQKGSNLAVTKMDDTKEIFEEQFGVVEGTNQVFEKISSFILEIEASVLQMDSEIEQVAEQKSEVIAIVQTMAALAEETAASCEQMSASTTEQVKAIGTVTSSAEDLTELSQLLKKAIERFKLQ